MATRQDENVILPPTDLQDKTIFIFNNLSQLNLNEKSKELRSIITEEYWPWMAHYMVMQRASVELNFHILFSQLLECLRLPVLYKMVTKETLKNIKILLFAHKRTDNFADRSVVRNLGYWLGLLTVRRNKPILYIDIDFKRLLIEAYHKGPYELIFVITFVAKVLVSCADSRVFRPPNPWTMGIMNTLAEIHQDPTLKTNVKFEIEILCKALSLKLADLKPTNNLQDPNVLNYLECQILCIDEKLPIANDEEQQLVQACVEAVIGIVTPESLCTSPIPPDDASESGSIRPTARFNYNDINVTGRINIVQYITINNELPLFASHLYLKQFVGPVVERTIQEWTNPIIEHLIKVSLRTVDYFIRKDFALDPDENRIRLAARLMVHNLTAALVMINCRKEILSSIKKNLKAAFQTAVMRYNVDNKLADQAADAIAVDNTNLACTFVQKIAMEKALIEIDKSLVNEMDLRKLARQEGKSYYNAQAKFQTEGMPKEIQLKSTGVTTEQMIIYEEFSKSIPGFLPIPKSHLDVIYKIKPIEYQSIIQRMKNLSIERNNVDVILDKLAREIEFLCTVMHVIAPHPRYTVLMTLRELIIDTNQSKSVTAGLMLLKKSVEGLLDSPPLASGVVNSTIILHYRQLHVNILKCLQTSNTYGREWTNKNVVDCWIACTDKLKYNFEAFDCFIKSQLIYFRKFDLALATAINTGNTTAILFATQLIQMYLIDERQHTCVEESHLVFTIECLTKMAHHRVLPAGIPHDHLMGLMKSLAVNYNIAELVNHTLSGAAALINSGIFQMQDHGFHDPSGLKEKSIYLLREWIFIHYSPVHIYEPAKAIAMFVFQMQDNGILEADRDSITTLFFKICTEICVELCQHQLTEPNITLLIKQERCYLSLDAFVRLISLLIKYTGGKTDTRTMAIMFNKILIIISDVLLKDHEKRGKYFVTLPFQRILTKLFLEFCAPEFEMIQNQILTSYCHTLHTVRPEKAPSFCYSWVEILSNSIFVERTLDVKQHQRTWGIYSLLLIDLFLFLKPYLQNTVLGKPLHAFYKGTLRVLLVLHHDFPEFFCDNYYGFCDVIPPNCVQVRNLILSAYPREMRLPDPFTPNLQIETVPGMNHVPYVNTNIASIIQRLNLKKGLDLYLKTRAPAMFLSQLTSILQPKESGIPYDMQLMNALIMYIGTHATNLMRANGYMPSMTTVANTAHMDIIQSLAHDLNTEGRYVLLNAIANHLRYPNIHTHYFSCTVLHLFADASIIAVKEQITRMLLERMIVNRPHPWGLIVTFIELIKKPVYNFWSHDFVRCAPEIEKMLGFVAETCKIEYPVQSSSNRELLE